MSQEGCGELRVAKIAGGLESWNPTLRKEREGWGTRPGRVPPGAPLEGPVSGCASGFVARNLPVGKRAMKLTVNRLLNGGIYGVQFSVSDFTPDEVKKMESFGIPRVEVLVGGPMPNTSIQPYRMQITKLSPQHKANFLAEDEAKNYEEKVVTEIREKMKELRARTDDFSSTHEVDI
jgi:hypothetical protein